MVGHWIFLVLFVAMSGLALPSAEAQQRKGRSVKKTAVTRSKKTAAKGSAPVVKVDPVVSEIAVEGQRKLEKDAILARLKMKSGDVVSEEAVRVDVLSLFELGYFNDIIVRQEPVAGGTVRLIYKVVEKPSMSEISFEGNTELKAEELLEGSGLKAYEILNQFKVRAAVEKLQKLYEDKGYFLAKIDFEIKEVKAEETVHVIFRVNEGEKVKVKKILFIGNDKLSSDLLKGRMFTQEEGYFSGLSGSGAFKQEAFERDIMALRFSYYNEGYIQAKVERPQISVTPDKKGIYLTFRIEEGKQYHVGDVEFDGDLMFGREELFQAIKLDENDVFAYDVLQRDLGELQAKYGDLGYAYANIIPRWNFREKENKVDIIFEIARGEKVYFGKINVTGNSKTRDKVVRRELKVREGELYNETRRRRSLENIQRLGFFEEVNFKTSTPPGRMNVMDLEIVVKERNTGQLQVSAGYGTQTGFTFGGSVQQTNFLGKGQNLGVSLNLSDRYQVYDVSFTEPYFRDSLWSTGFRAFKSSNSNSADYFEDRTGGSLSLGHPLGEYVRGYLTYGYTATRLSEVYEIDPDTKQRVSVTDPDLFPLDTASGDASTITGSIEYDSRNDRFKPTKGIFARGALGNTGLIGGNLKYYRASADFRFFKNLFWDVVWRNSMQWGQVGTTDGSEPPFNELFLLGGSYSLRGYRAGRVGREIRSQMLYDRYIADGRSPAWANDRAERFFGGRQQAQWQTELQFPLIREAEMYGVIFYDIGQANDILSEDGFYSDWGFGLRWFSPIGPLRFEWGFPFKRTSYYHQDGVFEFSIGTPF